MITARLLLLSACLAVLSVGWAQGGAWMSQPLVAHEWGVHIFDWQGNAPVDGALPAFVYTDAKPGKMIPVTRQVKEMPPDSGIRTKPILYFYSPGWMSPTGDTPVGVEVRFTAGHANAW